MVDTEELVYRKAYTELNEVFKRLSSIELSKIPQRAIENVRANMDTEYIWEYNDSKELEEQDFLVETKALIVEMYERYLCTEDKKEFWKKYDQVCLNMIEEKKREEYNPDNIFTKKEQEKIKETEEVQEKSLISYENASWYQKIFTSIKSFFKKLLIIQ